MWNKKGAKLALNINGKIVSVRILYEKFDWDDMLFDCKLNIDTLKKLIEPYHATARKRDSVLKSKKEKYEWTTTYSTRALASKNIYIGEKLAGQIKYNSTGRIMAEYYTGLLIDSIDENAMISTSYYDNGQKETEDYYDGSHFVYARNWYENGVLKAEYLDYVTLVQQPSIIKHYDETGRLTYCDSVVLLETLPGYQGEFNNPQIVFQKSYTEGKPEYEGQIYRSSAESDVDSCGTWKFYQNGKLFKTKTFKNCKQCYEEAVKASEV